MSDQPISPEMQRQIDHLGGKHVVVRHVYADGSCNSSLLDEMDDDSEAVALWQDAAFTNGPPLIEVRLLWDKAEADGLRAEHDAKEPTDV